MLKYLAIYEEAVSHHDFALDPFWISWQMRSIFPSFLSVRAENCLQHYVMPSRRWF
jgi:hypothetical protein